MDRVHLGTSGRTAGESAARANRNKAGKTACSRVQDVLEAANDNDSQASGDGVS